MASTLLLQIPRCFAVKSFLQRSSRLCLYNGCDFSTDNQSRPKRPPGSYFLFRKSVLNEISTSNPGITITEKSKIIGNLYKELSEEQKQKYKEDAARLIKDYKESLTEDDIRDEKAERRNRKVKRQKRKAKQLIKTTNKPKKPLSNFMKFHATNYPGGDLITASKLLKEEWELMSDTMKKQYAPSTQEIDDYKANLLTWENNMIQEGHNNLVRQKTLKALKLLPTPKKKKRVSGKKTAVKKATATKTTHKKSTKSPVKKTTAKTVATQTASTTVKSVAKKTSAKETPAKKTPAKKIKDLADTTSHYLSDTDSD